MDASTNCEKGGIKLGVGQDVNQYIMPTECHTSDTLTITLIRTNMLLDMVGIGPLKDLLNFKHDI